jgi:hypothetical protein
MALAQFQGIARVRDGFMGFADDDAVDADPARQNPLFGAASRRVRMLPQQPIQQEAGFGGLSVVWFHFFALVTTSLISSGVRPHNSYTRRSVNSTAFKLLAQSRENQLHELRELPPATQKSVKPCKTTSRGHAFYADLASHGEHPKPRRSFRISFIGRWELEEIRVNACNPSFNFAPFVTFAAG